MSSRRRLRGRGFEDYPDKHLAALTDRNARAALLTGSHSLWYEQAMWLLDEALRDLDDAAASVPSPVRTALDAELETEARWLGAALAEYADGVELPNDADRRLWDFGEPFVVFEGGLEGLSSRDREGVDDVEAGTTGKELRDASDDVRVLLDAHAQSKTSELHLEMNHLSISAEPEAMERFYVDVMAPLPSGKYNRIQWAVVIAHWVVDRWEVDDDGERYPGESHGEPVVRCDLPQRPTVHDVVGLLDLCTNQERLAAWSRTPAGQPLADTVFVVTKRYDELA